MNFLNDPKSLVLSLLTAAAILPAQAAPLILSQSDSMRVLSNRSFTAFVEATGGHISYQWSRNGLPLDGETSPVITIDQVGGKAGSYQVEITGPSGTTHSRPIELTVFSPARLQISAGGRGVLAVPGQLAYYDVYLPTTYHSSPDPFPVLLTFAPSGGGMVSHFQAVAEERKWIIIGLSQARNGYSHRDKAPFSMSVLHHALDTLRIDPNRIFASGMSGGGWSAFDFAKKHSPLTAGVFSMGGWLGGAQSTTRDIYLPGLKVARANGDNDTGANSWLFADRNHLQRYLSPSDIRDWSFSGGHVPAPAAVQREVFDWLIAETTASTAAERDAANRQEALWKARISAGQGPAVYLEIMTAAVDSARTPNALAAIRALDFLLERPTLFLRTQPDAFPSHPRRDYIMQHLYLSLFAHHQQRDPARLISGAAAARAFGSTLSNAQLDMWNDSEGVLRHPPRPAFDEFILENRLYDHPQPPYTGDWDGDGRDNFSEFALGSDPLVPDSPPPSSVHHFDGEILLTLPHARPGIFSNYHVFSAERLDGSWTPLLVNPIGYQPLANHRARLTWPAGLLETSDTCFFRISVSADHTQRRDSNGDGIPATYQFPHYMHWSTSTPNDTSTPDSRMLTEFPGGPPLYLRFLTAAEIGAVEKTAASLRHHPALLGYRGSLLNETWLNLPGNKIADSVALVTHRIPNDVRLILTSQAPWFRSGGNHMPGTDYFQRTRGYLIPSTSGNHIFSIAGDDECELWLSTNADPANKIRIGHVANNTSFQNYTANTAQTSAAIPLIADQRYYLEILHKQGGGEGHCSVAWIPPGTTTRSLIPPANLAPWAP